MRLADIKKHLPEKVFDILEKEIRELRPAQEKAIKAGLFEGKNLLVCTPTASGKTLVAELASLKTILEHKGKAVYIVPLRALASEKFREFSNRYGKLIKVALSIGDLDSSDPYLMDYDLILTTSEKLDSLIRHHTPWLKLIRLVIVDEIHLLNDPGRGPTLEILLAQFLGLSATIGNPKELADWLKAETIIDTWRPVKLYQGVYQDGKIHLKG
jgi:helicase